MQQVSGSGFAPGTIVVAAHFSGRYHEFWLSMNDLKVPQGTKLNLAVSCDVAFNFNNGTRARLEQGEWVWFMGDDHTFSPDILLNLLKRGKDVIQPLVPTKVAPFRPCLMHGPYKKGMAVYTWDQIPGSGVWEFPNTDYTGQAGLLIKESVLRSLNDPWFRPGQMEPDRLMEDIYFCDTLHKAGHSIWIDCDEVLGHKADIESKPVRIDGRWVPGIVSGRVHLAIPDAVGGVMDYYVPEAKVA